MLFVIIYKIQKRELSKMPMPTGDDRSERLFLYIRFRPVYTGTILCKLHEKSTDWDFVVFILHILCPCVKMRTIVQQ